MSVGDEEEDGGEREGKRTSEVSKHNNKPSICSIPFSNNQETLKAF